MMFCLEANGPVLRPISFAKELQRFGLNLQEAHHVLNELKAGKRARLQIHAGDLAGAAEIFRPYGVAIVSDCYQPQA